ncbi:hypothetical protein RQP46_001358 [Phenoliferia psychrophenolica]
MAATKQNFTCAACLLPASKLPLERQGKPPRCSKCLWAVYCGTECQKAHWKEHKPDCSPPIKPVTFEAELAALRSRVQDDISNLVTVRHIPGLYNGDFTPTFHFDFSYHPHETDPFHRFQLNFARETSRDNLATFLRGHNIKEKPFMTAWDKAHKEAKLNRARMELQEPTTAASPASHGARVVWIFSAIAQEGSPTQTLTTAVFPCNTLPLKNFTESALDPRNATLNWVAVVKRYFDDHMAGKPPAMRRRLDIARTISKYYIEYDEGWGQRGDGPRPPLAKARRNYYSYGMQDILANGAPEELHGRTLCVTYAFPQGIQAHDDI